MWFEDGANRPGHPAEADAVRRHLSHLSRT
jgi:hypothetical protein